MTSQCWRVGRAEIWRLTNRAGNTMIANSKRHSRNQTVSMPLYGKMPIGASPAKAFGERVSAGCTAVLNSSQGEDHWTSRRGGSGHWIVLAGIVSTVVIGFD